MFMLKSVTRECVLGWMRRTASAVIATLALAMVLQLVAPKAVHGVVAALVSVVGNVAVTNPADASGAAQPLMVQDLSSGGATPVYAHAVCTITPVTFDCSPLAPWPNKPVVVTDVSGECGNTAQMADALFLTYLPDGSTFYSIFGASYVGTGNGVPTYTFGRQTNIAVQQSVYPPVITSSGPFGNGRCTFSVVGYQTTP